MDKSLVLQLVYSNSSDLYKPTAIDLVNSLGFGYSTVMKQKFEKTLFDMARNEKWVQKAPKQKPNDRYSRWQVTETGFDEILRRGYRNTED